MFIRFVTSQKNEMTGLRLGIFTLAYDLLQAGGLPVYEEDEIKANLSWFKENLKIPKKFNRSTRHNREPKAISWYKDSAKECIVRMHR